MATIGITGEADLILNDLTNRFGFRDARDLALFAFAYSIHEDLPRKQIIGKNTKWGTSTFEDIDLDLILQVCYPNDEISDPINLFEELMHAGLYEINNKIKEKPNLQISDLLPKL